MNKLLLIARKEIAERFANPVILLLTVVVPLMIAALITLAFGDLVLGAGIPERKVPVEIVNQDRGSRWGNVGSALLQVMSPQEEESVLSAFNDWRLDLFEVRPVEEPAQARRMVEREQAVAALVIPPDFSETLLAGQATIELYVAGGESILGEAFGSLAQALANEITIGAITVRAAVRALSHNPRLRTEMEHGLLDDSLADLALQAVLPGSNPIQVQRIVAAEPPEHVKLTHFLAATIAILLVSFTALAGSASILQERTQGTLRRMFLTPTRPEVILGGKALGTYLSGLIHTTVLVGGMATLEWLLGKGDSSASPLSSPGLILLILATVAAATGFGIAVAGFARTYVEAANYGRAALVLMGLIGGIFFPVESFPPPLDLLSRLTFHYWAMDGYLKLARGGGVGSMLPHLSALWAMGTVFFAIGHWALRRRLVG